MTNEKVAHYHVTAFMLDGHVIIGLCGADNPPSLDCCDVLQLAATDDLYSYNEIRTKDIERLLVKVSVYPKEPAQ